MPAYSELTTKIIITEHLFYVKRIHLRITYPIVQDMYQLINLAQSF